ncbi:TPA: hypothetical protein QDB45_000887 [Burkholderia vietnamiensis]|nr:hypothetical protein [Burkholderia vietnamiensis]
MIKFKKNTKSDDEITDIETFLNTEIKDTYVTELKFSQERHLELSKIIKTIVNAECFDIFDRDKLLAILTDVLNERIDDIERLNREIINLGSDDE